MPSLDAGAAPVSALADPLPAAVTGDAPPSDSAGRPVRGRRKRGTRGGRARRGTRGRGRVEKPTDARAPQEAVASTEAATAETAPVVEPEVRHEPPARAERSERGERSERAERAAERAFAREHHGTEKTIIINAAPQETRLAILEKGQLAEIFIERESNRTVVGNIYKGRVTKVLPGMQSAFVAITLERDAFLYVSDISPGYDAYEGLLNLDEVEGGEAIRDAAPKVSREAKIEDLLKEGQELLVQVTKEPIGTKGARITSYVTLPGRFLVLMPQVDHVGVSRKIGDARERARLRRILDKVRVPGMGFIVRTVAEGCDATELEADANYLASLWDEIRRKAEKAGAPSEIHRELSLVPKVLRDMLNHSVSKVIIDDATTFQQASDLVGKLLPDMLGRINLYRETFPIFEKYGVQPELDKALRSRVWLKSGGYIVINQTEALVAIDVNTGKFVGRRNLEDTVLKTNLEAAIEICRQLRLRDLGGIIVVDFIDMEERKSKKKLIEAFERELEKDRARTKVLQISDFGLVEITRQRTKKSLERILCRPCPYCSGAGKIKAGATVLFEIQRELQKLAPNLDGKRLIIRANPEVAHQLEGDRRVLTAGIASLDHVEVAIRPDSTLHHEQFDIVSL
ncbi:MAG TPA: Rne/Rng family ribonuclease [Patescibacteria group bacterium]|nr:Rne/Rng family ribonuclease [Patescibacteria group bacterium]